MRWVSLLEMFTVLGKDDPDVTAFARKRLVDDGVEIHEGIAIKQISQDGNGIAVEIEVDGKTQRIAASHLLVAAGRRANVNGLNLEAAGSRLFPQGDRGR